MAERKTPQIFEPGLIEDAVAFAHAGSPLQAFNRSARARRTA